MSKQSQPDDQRDFSSDADSTRLGLVAEFIAFLKHNKKWWMVPIVVLVILFGMLVWLGGTAAGPFVYTLF